MCSAGLVSVAEIENTRSTERYKDVQNNAQVLGLFIYFCYFKYK